jgi:hypothetical protein
LRSGPASARPLFPAGRIIDRVLPICGSRVKDNAALLLKSAERASRSSPENIPSRKDRPLILSYPITFLNENPA